MLEGHYTEGTIEVLRVPTLRNPSRAPIVQLDDDPTTIFSFGHVHSIEWALHLGEDRPNELGTRHVPAVVALEPVGGLVEGHPIKHEDPMLVHEGQPTPRVDPNPLELDEFSED
jgi:hypothetical protein